MSAIIRETDAFRWEGIPVLAYKEDAGTHFKGITRQVLVRDQILDRVWGDAMVESNAIEVHIGRLRDKLEADEEERLIQTIRGAGYALREEA